MFRRTRITVLVLLLFVSGVAGSSAQLFGPPKVQSGPDFVFTAYDILESNFYDPALLKPGALYDASLQGLAKYLKEGHKLTVAPSQIPATALQADAQKQFAVEFSLIATSAKNLKLEPYELEFAATAFLLEAVGDSHVDFMSPKALARHNELKTGKREPPFFGIGVKFTQIDPDFSYVSELVSDSPAERAGVQLMDRIVAIDGEPMPIESGYAVILIKGSRCTSVVLGIERVGVRMDIVIERDVITPTFKKERIITVGAHRFGYLHLNDFALQDKEFDDIVRQITKEEADGVNGFIIDVRRNLGGRLDIAKDFLSMFLPKGTACFVEVSANKSETFTVSVEPLTNLPVVILIDEDSASASEVLSGVLQEQGRALIVGTKSAGALSIARVFDLPDAAGIKVAIKQFFTAQGKSFEKVGVMPDALAILTRAGIARGEDTQLKTAIEALEKQVP